MAVLLARGLKRDDFAKYHPAGPLAGRCLARGDIMRTGPAQRGGRAIVDRQGALLVDDASQGWQSERDQ